MMVLLSTAEDLVEESRFMTSNFVSAISDLSLAFETMFHTILIMLRNETFLVDVTAPLIGLS